MTKLALAASDTVVAVLPVPLFAGLPRSASSSWVGAAGVAAALASIVLLQSWLQPSWIKAIAVMALVALAMIGTDAAAHGPRGQSRGLGARPLRAPDLIRIGQKLIGFWVTIGVLAAGYCLFPIYAAAPFEPFRQAAFACLPALVIIAPFYVAFVDRRQSDPDDAYVQLSALLAGRRPDDWIALRQHALGWMVKGFFLPLMFGYLAGDLASIWSGPLIPRLDDFESIFGRLIDLLYLLDVLLATISYALTLRLLDTHIRSTEPTFMGWAAALLCYPPFNQVTGTVLPYDQDKLFWGKVFAPMPMLYIVWGSAVLVLVAFYMWSTAAFGLRFSNLTHRGIITNGPYRWTKHPAYLCKSVSWWMISVPFIAGAGWAQAVQSCLLMGCVNAIYFLRARTEERHLSHDPAYRDYAAFIARDGLAARIRRLIVRG